MLKKQELKNEQAMEESIRISLTRELRSLSSSTIAFTGTFAYSILQLLYFWIFTHVLSCQHRQSRLAEDRLGFAFSDAVFRSAAIILLHPAQLPVVRRSCASDRATSRASRQAHGNAGPTPSAIEPPRDSIAGNHDTTGGVSSQDPSRRADYSAFQRHRTTRVGRQSKL